MDTAPVFRYSPATYRLAVAAGVVIFCGMLAYGIAVDAVAAIAGGVAGLAFVGLFARAAREKLAGGRIALMRDGDVLIGGELSRPLLMAGMSFAIESDHQGSWVIVLQPAAGDQRVRLSTGGWALDGERRVTKQAAERALLGMGLMRRA